MDTAGILMQAVFFAITLNRAGSRDGKEGSNVSDGSIHSFLVDGSYHLLTVLGVFSSFITHLASICRPLPLSLYQALLVKPQPWLI